MVGRPQSGFCAVAQFISDDLCCDSYSVLGPVGAVVAHEYIVNALKQVDVFVSEVIRMRAGEPFRIVTVTPFDNVIFAVFPFTRTFSVS